MVARHDFVFTGPAATRWPNVDFGRFNFLSRCEPMADANNDYFQPGKVPCVGDMLFTMPGRLFASFDQAVGQPGCFNATGARDGAPMRYMDAGHWRCFDEVSMRFPRASRWNLTTGFLTTWRPSLKGLDKHSRELNPIGHLVGCRKRTTHDPRCAGVGR